MKVSEYIAEELFKLGIRHVFGYQGGNITHIVDAVATHGRLRFIQTSHEQGAAFAANGYAQSWGDLGVAIASSGPGALNLVTGVANAYFDSIPVLFITGDLSRRYKKCGLPLRQDGFQSTDIISIVQPITKYAEMLQSPSDICFCLKRAIFEATTGRRGPVFLSIPHWIQCAEIDPSTLKDFTPEYENFFSLSSMLLKKDILGTLQRCHRPLLLVGGGCCDQETKNMLIKFLERNPIPVVASLCGLNALPHDHPSYVGFIGDYGHRHANLALSASDCLIVLGARMDDRQIGALKESHTNKTIIHVDIDPSELQTYSEYYLPINDSIANFLNILNTESFNMITGWNNEISHLKSKYPIITLQNSFTAPVFLRRLSEFLLPNAQVFVDVGLHQMCSAQALELSKQKTMFVSGGLGSMGYALPACIGGYFASPERQTICISGDGGLLMSLNELQTIARERLNVKIIVLNNHCLGMILDYQRKNFNGRAFGSVEGYQPCNLEKTAGAFDLFFHKFSNLDDICNLFEVLDHHGPTLIEVDLQQDMLPFPNGIDYPLTDTVLELKMLND